MSERVAAQPQKISSLVNPAAQSGLLQRKCACGSGGSAGLTGACDDCGRKRLLGLQPKLEVSQPGDSFEREADRVADEVMRQPASAPSQHMPARPALQRQAITPVTSSAAAAGAVSAPPVVQDALDSPGQPLDTSTRSFMESRFGHNFGHVRVHTDGRAQESARAVDSLAYTVGHNVVFAEGRYAPATSEGRRLLAHELTHVLQQAGGLSPNPSQRIMRKACAHDTKGTGCGPGGGKIKFPDEILHLDQTVVQKGLSTFGGKWLTEVQTPVNPKKTDAKEGGRVDGLRVSEKGGLAVEVVEVKPRSPGGMQSSKTTGGCALASVEAKGYVAELQKLAPKIKTLSEKFSKIGGYRLMDHHKPKNKVEKDIFTNVGVDIDNQEWFDAWKFYNSIQNKWPKVFTKSFGSVSVSLFADGQAGKQYDAFGWLAECDDKGTRGIEKLVYMLNNEGGVSYGCEKECKPEKEKKKEPEKKKEKKEETKTTTPAAPVVSQETLAAIKKLTDLKQTLSNELDTSESEHKAQTDLIYKPSYVGFWGFWTNRLFNKEVPPLSIWDHAHTYLIRADNALKANNVETAVRNIVKARRFYWLARKEYVAWKDGLPGAAVKMQAAIGIAAVAAVVAFVAPTVVASAARGAAGASSSAAATQMTARIVLAMEAADTTILAAEGIVAEAEIVAAAELEAETILMAIRAGAVL